MAATRANNLGLMLCLCAGGAAFGETPRICELAVKHRGLVQYTVQVEPDQSGTRTIKADIDLDGADDALRWSDSGAFTLTLTSNRKSFTLVQQRLNVVKFESHYFIATLRTESELGPWYRDVFAVTQNGITEVCSFEGKGQAP